MPSLRDVVTATFDAAGRTVTRTVTVPSGAGFASSTETYAYGYHGKTTSMRLTQSTGMEGCVPTFPPAATFAPEQVWTYRYGPNGVREQRRLMMSPMHDSAGCSGILPWTYYVNDPSGLVLAVYHGRQMKRSQLGAGCPDPPTPPTEPTRRVFMYPVEYRAYGPDGINVVYERENYGVNAGQWVKRYLTTDYQGSVLQAHDASGNHEQHYELFGAEKGQVSRRTGWLDREIDWETSPLSDLYRTVDLVNRKYDPQRATFLTSDPLWMMSADASSYHYGHHDPMNMIDPWGLSQITTMQPDDETGNGGGGTSGGTTNSESVTPFDNSFFWDRIYGERLRSIGLGGLPGAGVGRGGGLGPVGGSNGANGKSDPASPPKQGQWAGVPYQSSVSKLSLVQRSSTDDIHETKVEHATILVTASRITEAEHLANDAIALAQAYSWFQFGLGQTLIMDHRLVTFRDGRQSDLSAEIYGTLDKVPIGGRDAVNFFDTGITAFALLVGQVHVTRLGDETFAIEIEKFDFEWRNGDSCGRNIGTVFGNSVLYNYNPSSPLYPFWPLPVALGGPFDLGFDGPIVIRR